MTTITTRDEALDFLIEFEMNYLNAYKVVFALIDADKENANQFLNETVKGSADLYSNGEMSWKEVIETIKQLEKYIENKI